MNLGVGLCGPVLGLEHFALDLLLDVVGDVYLWC